MHIAAELQAEANAAFVGAHAAQVALLLGMTRSAMIPVHRPSLLKIPFLSFPFAFQNPAYGAEAQAATS